MGSPRLRWLGARMEARYALSDAHAAGLQGDALLALATGLARNAAEQLGPTDAATLLGEPWLAAERVLELTAERCYTELYEFAAASGWLLAA